ncbi:hypothetical protein LXL04_007429 [Taraxacum kok-saghyz]
MASLKENRKNVYKRKLTRFMQIIVLGSFENSYISENPRTPPISYISQTVISFKKPTSEPSKTYLSVFETKSYTYARFFFCIYANIFEKKKLFFRKFFFATSLKFERFLAPRSRFFEKVNGLGVLGVRFNREP